MGNLTSNLASYLYPPPETSAMNDLEWARERQIAELAVVRACMLTKKVLANVESIQKTDLSPVTVADFASQALLISAVETAFGTQSVVGEEDARKLREDEAKRIREEEEEEDAEKSHRRETLGEKVFGLVQSVSVNDPTNGKELGKPKTQMEMMDMIDRGGTGEGHHNGLYWVMDPVDGTKAYIEGGQYAISLALMKDRKEVLGVLGCPNLTLVDGRIYDNKVDEEGMGVIFTAVKGQGVTVRRVSLDGKLGDATPLPRYKNPVNIQETHFVSCAESPQVRQGFLAQLSERLNVTDPGTDVWSSHMRYAALAIGGADAQVRVPPETKPKPVRVWDHAGSQLIFTEMGGKITDLDGKEMDYSSGRSFDHNRGMIVAKPEIHAHILAATRALLNEDPLDSRKGL